MYFYAVTGKQKVKTVVETTDGEGEVTLVTSVTEVDCKGMLTLVISNVGHKHGGFVEWITFHNAKSAQISRFAL